MMAPRQKYLTIWATFAFLPMAVVATINYLVDPFQYFRVSNPPRFSNLMQRSQHPGIIRNYAFNSIVVGNSFVANLQNELFDRKEFGTGIVVQNLSFWGSTLREAAYVADLTLRTKSIKTVYWGFGREWVLTDFRDDEFPTCMYRRFWSHLPYCYLFNLDILSESLAAALALNRLSKAGWVASLEKWKLVPAGKIDTHALACEVQHEIRQADIDRLTQDAENDLAPANTAEIARFREIVLPIVRANRRIHFVFFVPPAHVWPFWHNAVKQGTLKRERALIDVVIGEPNVEVHEMTGLSSVTHDSALFSDMIHYNLEGARLVVDALASGSQKVTSIRQHEEMLRRELRSGAEIVRKSFEAKCP
jgi:hypothetical protein